MCIVYHILRCDSKKKQEILHSKFAYFPTGDAEIRRERMSPEISKKFDEWIDEKFIKEMGITFPKIK